ncbi:transcription factor HES-7-like [Pelobates fuscus]|uniref:transcription factor HES-7-like n=1 Tax=Pelobates fuscus TaxID=191477 RepID=UPI002FE4F778
MRNSYLSKEDKKLMKPVIEKRRRDRINQSLEHLRMLLLEATKDESLKNPKTEKADILTKTVHFLKLCHEPGTEDAMKTKSGFKGGFQEGLSQAATFLNSTASISETKRGYVVEKLCQHMENRTFKSLIEPAQEGPLGVNHRETIPSLPQISRIPVELKKTDQCPERQSCTPLPQNYQSSSSSVEVSGFRPESPSSTQKVHTNSSKESVQRTLFPAPTSNSHVPPTLVWRPWP